jgi:DNA-binding CsgD family transcriptional regulator
MSYLCFRSSQNMKKSPCTLQIQPEQPLRELLFKHPHLMSMVHALGLRGPYGSASMRQICKDQNVLEPVLVALLEASICPDFELKETFPAYGLLQLCDLTRKVMDDLLLQLQWLPELTLQPLKAHQEELEKTVLPHINGIYELYYSPEYTSGKSNLLGYSIEFFPKNKLPLEQLLVVEDRLEEGADDAFENWQTSLLFHQNIEQIKALQQLEERLLKPMVLQMEEDIIRTFQKRRTKPLRLAFLTLAEAEPQPELLSKREQEVLSLVAQGLMNKEIADRLHISLTTVISHRKNLVGKLGIHSLAGLTVYAYTHGFLDAFILTNED